MNDIFFSNLFITSALIIFLLIIYVLINAKNSVSKSLILLLSSVFIWSLFYGIELRIDHNFQILKLIHNIQYIGIVSLPVFWFVFSCRYTGRDQWANYKNIILLSVIPLMTLVLVFTNQHHGLFYTLSSLSLHESGYYHNYVPGFFYWVHLAYSYSLVFIALFQLILMLLSESKENKRRAFFILLSSLFPIVFSLLYSFGNNIGVNVNLTPVGFTFMTLMIIFGVYNNILLDFKPLVLNALFENLPDAIFATDNKGNILSSNPKTKELLNKNLLTLEAFNSVIKSKAFCYNNVDNTFILEINSNGKYYRVQKTEVKNKRDVKTGEIFMVKDITIEKNNNDELKKSQEKYQVLFENAHEGILVVQDRKIVFFNPTIEKLSGYSSDELLSKTLDEVIHKEDRVKIWKIYQMFMKNEKFNEKNYIRLQLRKYTSYWVEFNAVPIDWNGERAGLIFVNDINEKKQSEELKELLIKVSNDYINAPVEIFVETIIRTLREIGKFVNADRAYIFDYDWDKGVCNNTFEWCEDGVNSEIDNLQGVPIDVLPQWVDTHKKNLPMFVDNVDELEKNDPLRDLLEPQMIKSTIAIPMFNEGVCSGFVGFDSVKILHKYSDKEKVLLQVFAQMLVNLTNRKNDNELIERQIIEQQLINDISTELISANYDNQDKKINLVLSQLGEFLKIDRSYLLQYSTNSNEEGNIHDWYVEGFNSIKDRMKEVMMDVYPWWKSEIEKKEMIVIPDVNLLPDEASKIKAELIRQGVQSKLCMPIVNNSKLIGFVGVETIITQRNWTQNEINVLVLIGNILGDTIVRIDTENELLRAKELAEAASVAKSNFLSNMSHEIRTPLNGVIGFTELMRNTSLTNTQRDYLDNAINAANSLLSVISDILDFSKIESGKLEIEKVKTDIIQLFENSSDIIKLHASTKGLELLLNIAPDIPRYALIDPIRLKQILVNLLSNAVKFTHVGEIEFSLNFNRKNDKTGVYSIKVRDTGIGIKEEDKNKLFKAFSQADTSTTRRYGGTGLGLIISNSLATKMNSEIKFESEYGHGATFYFDLECEYEEGNVQTDLISNISSVLVVDDNSNNRLILEHTLTYKGLVFTGADSCHAAINILRAGERFDLIIVDYHMPDIDGLDTIREIRALLDDVKKQPVIMLHSSSDDVELHEKARKLGVSFLLTKPVKQDELFYYLCGINKDNGIITAIDDQKTGDQKTGDQNLKNIDSSGFTIMVVEDTPMNMMVVTRMIKTMLPDVKLIEAKNGIEAIKFMKSNNPSLIFMDVQMPEMDGIEATGQIRKLRNGASVPIVALTAGVSNEERDRCFNAGMNDFLAKPIEKNELERLVHKYLQMTTLLTINNHEMDKGTGISFNKVELMSKIGDKELMNNILQMAKSEFPIYIDALESAFRSGDIDKLKTEAHRLKGSALNMEFPIMAAIVKDIEACCDDKDQIEILINKLKGEWVIILDILDM